MDSDGRASEELAIGIRTHSNRRADTDKTIDTSSWDPNFKELSAESLFILEVGIHADFDSDCHITLELSVDSFETSFRLKLTLPPMLA